MNERLSALEQDIGFLKSLAVQGRSATLVGGSILVAAGATFGLASLAQWAALSDLAPARSGWTYPFIWMTATVAFLVESWALRRRLGPHKAGDTANRAAGAAWAGVGATIFALVACVAIVSWRTGSDAPTLLLPSIVLSLYGLGWTVAASVTRKTWVWGAAFGSYVAAVIVAVFCGQTSVYLIFAAALTLLAVVPGLAMIRLARAAA